MKDQEGNLIVVKANKLIQQLKFSLSAQEMQIVNFIIANINSPLYDEEFNTLEFEIKDFYKMMGIENPGGSSYEYVKRVIQGLRNKTSDYINFGEYETIVSWIEKPKFYKKSGKVKLKLDDDLKPYLLKANGIMRSQLKYYFQMESKYSMRLYELLKSWDGYNKITYDFERLRLSVDAISKSYEKWYAFEKKVLEPAIKEINDITDLEVRYEKTTQGRGGKIKGVTFYYSYKPDMKPKSSKETIYVEAIEVPINESEPTEEIYEEYKENSIFSFSEQENNPEDAYDEDILLYAEMCKLEFTNKQMRALVNIAREKLIKQLMDIPYTEPERRERLIADYISEKYNDLDTIEIKTTRLATLRDRLKNGY